MFANRTEAKVESQKSGKIHQKRGEIEHGELCSLVRIINVGFNITMLSHIREMLGQFSKEFLAKYFTEESKTDIKFQKLLANLKDTEDSLKAEYEYRNRSN